MKGPTVPPHPPGGLRGDDDDDDAYEEAAPYVPAETTASTGDLRWPQVRLRQTTQ